MPRIHFTLTPEQLQEIDAICELHCLSRPRIFRRAVEIAIDELRKRPMPATEAANEPVAAVTVTTATLPPAVPLRPVGGIGTSFRKGDTVWFDLQFVCSELDITVTDLMDEIDPTDDVLDYQGRRWIDAAGINEARMLCRDGALSDRFWEEAQRHISAI